MNAFAGIRPKGSKPDPLAFFPGVCSGGYLFSTGGPTPPTPANFYPARPGICSFLVFILKVNWTILADGHTHTHDQTHTCCPKTVPAVVRGA